MNLQNFTPLPKIHIEEELERVNRVMYERNAELAVRNKTLSVLRKIYEIINTTLGVKETAQKISDTIISELKFQKIFIALVDKQESSLKSLAASVSSEINQEIFEKYNKPFKNFNVPLADINNLCAKSINTKHHRLTNTLFDILTPTISEEEAEVIERKLNIRTSIVYPIIFAGEVLGVFTISFAKHVGGLSRAERETLHELIEVIGIAIKQAQIYADLKDANIRLRELDKLKDEFVSLASHELRTPMTAIKSYLWMALAGKGGPLVEKQKFYLQRAYNSTTRLINLVNDMLNVSRIESGRITLKKQSIDLVGLIEDIIAEVKPRADELGIRIKFDSGAKNFTPLEVPETPPPDSSRPQVFVDPDKIKEVLINLVGNSLKFTPKDGTITISYEKQNSMIKTVIKDTGVGIAPEDMLKLFQKFGIVEGAYIARQNVFQGTGLGLYISKSIIEMHGGKIEVFSDGKNKGATFSFTLPTAD